MVATVCGHAHEWLRHETRERAELTANLFADLAVGTEAICGQFGAVEVEVEFELTRSVLMVALDHVETHGLSVLDDPVDERLKFCELIDVVAVRLRKTLDGRLSVGVGLEPHHFGFAAGSKVQAMLGLELGVNPLEVSAAIRGQKRSAVHLLFASAEESTKHARCLVVPRQAHEGLDLGDADQFLRLGSVADVVTVAIDEQVCGRSVDELEALAGDRSEVLCRDAFAHDSAGDRDELAIEVLNPVSFDLSLDLGYLCLPAFCLDELFYVA